MFVRRSTYDAMVAEHDCQLIQRDIARSIAEELQQDYARLAQSHEEVQAELDALRATIQPRGDDGRFGAKLRKQAA